MPAFSSLITSLVAASAFVDAAPVPSYWKAQRRSLQTREVPLEHSHEAILTVVRGSLNTNNPGKIQDVVFGLLGNAAAATGAGNIKDTECLQQAISDQAFTNAKAAKDIAGMTAALQFRALERNTGQVGLQSNQCTTITAVNPEIAAIKQHQDPASQGAAATNKAIVLELAKQIASIGGDPQAALLTGTFAPGKIGDPTAKGNTCDDPNDPKGCIITLGLLVEDATPDEINAAVVGAASSSGAASGSSSGAASASSSGAASSSSGAASASTGADASGADDTEDCSDGTGDAATASSSSSAAVASSTNAAAASGSASNLNFGSCPPPEVIGAVGLDGRTEFAFEPKDLTAYAHSSAQNIQIITDFMCNTLVNSCGLKQTDSTFTFCKNAVQQIGAGKNDGSLADKWNALFGVTTDFQNAQGSSTANGAAPAAGSGSAPVASASSAAAGSQSTGAASSGSASSGSTGSAAAGGALSFGSCSNPTIEFGGSFDGRTEQAFAPENSKDFNHGSADNIPVLTGFICQQLASSCKAPQATLDACATATTAAAAVKGGAAADAFNAALGFTTDFANNPVTDGSIPPSGAASSSGSASSSSGAGASSGSGSSSSNAGSGAASASSSAASSSNTGAASSSSSSSGTAAAGSGNFQTFTGSLGGAPPPVTNSGDATRRFEVNGDTFVNVSAALQRSCSIQHNACANAANAGGAAFSVSDCETQESACNAADAGITA